MKPEGKKQQTAKGKRRPKNIKKTAISTSTLFSTFDIYNSKASDISK